MSYFQDCIYLFVFLWLLVSPLGSESDLTNEWKEDFVQNLVTCQLYTCYNEHLN